MTWRMHDKEFESVLSLPGPRRYEYFVKRVADRGTLWSLGSDTGWALTSDDDGNEIVPVWPHERFAQAYASQEWQEKRPRSLELAEWMDKWLPGMMRDHRLVAVFPTPEGKGVVVTPERLRDDLEEELSRIE
jgi:Protein of unknown function (DUF2750)